MKPEDQPLEALQACHARIEEQLQALERLAHDAAPSAAGPAAAKAVVGFFDTSGAQHHRDEDEDLFPLLRARAAALGRIEVAAAIDELEREHATMDAQWQRLRQKLAAIVAAREGAFETDEVARFAWLYRRHMDREALLVLPFARETLGTGERAELAARMAARRGAK